MLISSVQSFRGSLLEHLSANRALHRSLCVSDKVTCKEGTEMCMRTQAAETENLVIRERGVAWRDRGSAREKEVASMRS